MENFLNLIFSPKCLFCDCVGKVICNACLGTLKPLCRKFSFGMSYSSFCLFEYHGCVRKCIRYSKYAPRMFSALKVMAKWGVDSMPLPDYSGFVVVPIPLGHARRASRGYNQSQIIAKTLADKLGLRVQESILSRSKETLPQYALNKKERLKNLAEAFSVQTDVKGKKILVVDDICTSGSTFISAAGVLYAAGAESVECFALSKKL